jgi:hypothetical protein
MWGEVGLSAMRILDSVWRFAGVYLCRCSIGLGICTRPMSNRDATERYRHENGTYTAECL